MTTLSAFCIVMAVLLIPGIAFVASVTKRRRLAQCSKRDTEHMMLRALIDNMPDFMYVKDLQMGMMILCYMWL
jgi:hypothetical protein